MEFTHRRSRYMIPEEKRDGTVLMLSDLMWEPDAGWRESAACSGVDSDTFFPASEEESATKAAKRICSECPVRDTCLQYALSTNQTSGVWGGLDAGERRRMRRRLRDRERRKAS